MKKFSIISGLIFFTFCARFQIYDLSSSNVISIPVIEYNPEKKINDFYIPVLIQENLVYRIPQSPTIYDNEVLLPIPEMNFIAYFPKLSDKPAFLITSKNNKNELAKIYQNIPIKIFSEGIIGESCIQDNYMVFRIFLTKEKVELNIPPEPENRMPAILYPQTKNVNPSRLFLLNKSNMFVEKEKERLLLEPINDKDYTELIKFYCFPDYVAIVRFLSEKEAILNFYNIKDKNMQDINIDIKSLQDPSKNEIINIENIFVLENRDVFIEVASRDKKSYKNIYKKIYKYNNKLNLFFDNDDLESSLFYIFPDNSFYLAKEDDEDLLIKIYDNKLNYQKNNRIRFDRENNYWKEYWINLEGRIFSSKLQENLYSIVEWK